jgi:hypothetical protein
MHFMQRKPSEARSSPLHGFPPLKALNFRFFLHANRRNWFRNPGLRTSHALNMSVA